MKEVEKKDPPAVSGGVSVPGDSETVYPRFPDPDCIPYPKSPTIPFPTDPTEKRFQRY